MSERSRRNYITADQIDALDRLSKASRGLNPDGTPKEPAQFEVEDRYGRRTLTVPATAPPWSGDPRGIVLDIEARTRTRLRDGGDPDWFIRLDHHFTQRRDPDAGVSFAEYCAARHHDKVEALDERTRQCDPATEAGAVEPAKPERPRLWVDADRDVAELDGERHPLTPDGTRVLSRLAEAEGGWVPGANLKAKRGSGERIDRIIKGMPAPIRAIIKSKQGTGYRLTCF